MFESLFRYPSVLARHRDGPAAEERRRFLFHRLRDRRSRPPGGAEIAVAVHGGQESFSYKWARAGCAS